MPDAEPVTTTVRIFDMSDGPPATTRTEHDAQDEPGTYAHRSDNSQSSGSGSRTGQSLAAQRYEVD